MAFLFEQKKSPYWYAGFNDHTGVRRNRSTKVLRSGNPTERKKRRKKAQGIADELEAIALGQKTALQLRKSMAELHEQATGERITFKNMTEAAQSWLNGLRNTIQDTSLPTYESHIRSFLSYLDDKASWEVHRISRNDIEGFRDATFERVSATSTNNNLKTLRMFFRSMKEQNIIGDPPTEFVKTVKENPDSKPVQKEAFTLKQVRTILAHCEDDEWKSLVLWAYSTGQRLGDLARLKWKAIDTNKGSFSFISKKTQKAMNLPLHPDLLKILKSLPQPINKELPIHPNAFAAIPVEGPRKGKASTLSNQFSRILVKAGLREKRPHRALGNGRNGRKELNALTFHSFRKTAATTLAEQGVPRAVAMELIGHDNADVHEAYIRISTDAMREGIAKIPSVL